MTGFDAGAAASYGAALTLLVVALVAYFRTPATNRPEGLPRPRGTFHQTPRKGTK